MKILIGCEESGKVRDAFRALGHDAISCDILPTRRNPKFHIQGDVLPLLRKKWDMAILFPPCTHLASSGAASFAAKRADGRQADGIAFFMACINVNAPRVCVENPVGIMSTVYRKPDQIIHPWQFGHPEQKTTCLWLKGLPPLKETQNVKAYMLTLPKRERERLHYLSPSPERARLRSETFQGVADAMAAQWGNL